MLGNLPWVSGFVFSEILSPPFVDENIAQIFEKAPGHLPHTQMVMGILAEHSPESPIISFDHRSDEEWKEFSRLKYIKKLTDDEIVFWRSKFQRRAAAFSRVLDKLNIGYINISMGLMDRNLMGRDSLKTEFEVMGPFLEALLNPSRAVVFQASPGSVSASDHVDLSSSYINRLQVVGFSTEDSKKQTYKDGTKRDIIVNTGDIHDLENKRCYLYTEDCSIGGGDNPGSSFSTPLAVSIAVWLRETQFASEPWSPELVQKIITALKTQAIWYPLHEGQTMGHHLGYISPWVSDWQRLNDLGYPQFNSWEEACRYFKHPNFKSVEELEKMLEEQQHRQNPNFKSVEDLKKMVGE